LNKPLSLIFFVTDFQRATDMYGLYSSGIAQFKPGGQPTFSRQFRNSDQPTTASNMSSDTNKGILLTIPCLRPNIYFCQKKYDVTLV